MKSIVDVVKDPSKRPAIVSDCVTLIDGEVSKQGGIAGFALKAGYKVVASLKGGRMIPTAVDGLLDDFAAAIQPLVKEYQDGGAAGGFDKFLVRNADRAANALLAITDGKIRRVDNTVISGTYAKLRPTAEAHVKGALEGVGRLIGRYTS